MLVLLLAGCAKDNGTKEESSSQSISEEDGDLADSSTSEASAENVDAQEITEGGSLEIPVSELSSTVKFYPVKADGVNMEVLAVKDSEGKIRTAFNTCQVCYGSGRGYYKQSGDKLVCQNCGNQFTVNQVEVQSGGCNPWPIFDENKTVTDETVSISYDYLKEATQIFANWKTDF
ncbi:MAG: DUF2318 domain-containing protein [Muricomes sp.]